MLGGVAYICRCSGSVYLLSDKVLAYSEYAFLSAKHNVQCIVHAGMHISVIPFISHIIIYILFHSRSIKKYYFTVVP